MKEITAILLIIIALIGIISIIIVKLYYREKEKDEDKEKLEEFINSTQADYENEKRKRVRKNRKSRANYSEAQSYANTIDSQYKEGVKDSRRARKAVASDDYIENENIGGTTALLRQRREAMENAPKKQVRKVRRAQAGQVPKKQVAGKKVQRTPERVQTQMNKEEEVKSFQEPITPEHTATINSAKQKLEQPKARQEPMTEKQKEFIAKDANKLVIEDTDSTVKVVKSIKPADSIEEIKESAKIVEKDEIVEKAEQDTAELIKEIEEAKEGAAAELAEAEEKAEEIIADTEEKAEETPKIESTIEKIKQATEEKEKAEAVEETTITPEAEETTVEAKVEDTAITPEAEETTVEAKVEETAKEPEVEDTAIVPEVEDTSITPEVEEEKPTFMDGSSKISDKISQVAEKVYNDDLHILLNKDEKVEEDKTPENDFVTINAETETSSTSNELINNAIRSIRNFRKPNVPEKPVIVEEVDDIVPDDYAQDLGDGIEYIGDTITITPIHEEERTLVHNQPNEDVDKIYKEINGESYNKTDDEELSKSFEDVTDETSEEDANVYTDEDYKKIEAKEQEKKRRAENTKKILGLKGIEDIDEKSKSRRGRKPVSDDLEDGQRRLVFNKTKNDVEEVYINGTLFELKVGQVVMFDINGETYSSQILKLKPGYIGVRYRSKKIWVKSNSVKKILK